MDDGEEVGSGAVGESEFVVTDDEAPPLLHLAVAALDDVVVCEVREETGCEVAIGALLGVHSGLVAAGANLPRCAVHGLGGVRFFHDLGFSQTSRTRVATCSICSSGNRIGISADSQSWPT